MKKSDAIRSLMTKTSFFKNSEEAGLCVDILIASGMLPDSFVLHSTGEFVTKDAIIGDSDIDGDFQFEEELHDFKMWEIVEVNSKSDQTLEVGCRGKIINIDGEKIYVQMTGQFYHLGFHFTELDRYKV